jgi:uncharacterized protein (TIRG00374 family)
MFKKYILTIIKWAAALAIIWYMISSGRLDLEKLAHARLMPFAGACLVFTLNVALLQAFRWKLCLRAQGIDESLLRICQYNMIAMFTTIFMPGAIGGDFFKCLLVARDNPGRKATVIATVMLDRAFGLFAVLVWGCGALLFNPGLKTSASLQSLFVSAALVLAGVTGFSLLSFKYDIEHAFMKKLFSKLPMGGVLKDMYHALNSLGRHPGILLKLIPLSLLVIFNAGVCFYLYGIAMGQYLDFWLYFSVVPIGFIITSLPVSPAGLGVGQAAFYQLFAVNSMPASLGAEVFTLSQAAVFICGIPGVFMYLLMKKKVDQAIIEQKEV